jgi:hypothetical protein
MSELFDELKYAVRLHDEWPDAATRTVVIDSARRLVQAVEQRAEKIAYMQASLTPTAEAVAQIIGDQ